MIQAEARLAAKRAARAEAREIRMKELERQQKDVRRLLFWNHISHPVIWLVQRVSWVVARIRGDSSDWLLILTAQTKTQSKVSSFCSTSTSFTFRQEVISWSGSSWNEPEVAKWQFVKCLFVDAFSGSHVTKRSWHCWKEWKCELKYNQWKKLKRQVRWQCWRQTSWY